MRITTSKSLFAALLLGTAMLATPAAARTHHHHAHHHHHARRHHHLRHHHLRQHQVETAPEASRGLFSLFDGNGNSIVRVAKSQIGNGPVYGRRSLWCARFMNWVLEKTGHKGTGSDMATSFEHIGHRISGPKVGAIAVMGRRGGGHVGVVVGITPQGDPVLVSGNHGNRVRESVYPKRRIRVYVSL